MMHPDYYHRSAANQRILSGIAARVARVQLISAEIAQRYGDQTGIIQEVAGAKINLQLAKAHRQRSLQCEAESTFSRQ